MKAVAILVAIATVSGVGVQVVEQKKLSDIEQLQGAWKVVAVQYRSLATEKSFIESVVKIEGGTVKMLKDGKVLDTLHVTLDATKEPKQIDLFGKRDKTGLPLLGIYAIDKGKIKLSWSMNDGRDRPQTFEVDRTDKKGRQISLVLERAKEVFD